MLPFAQVKQSNAQSLSQRRCRLFLTWARSFCHRWSCRRQETAQLNIGVCAVDLKRTSLQCLTTDFGRNSRWLMAARQRGALPGDSIWKHKGKCCPEIFVGQREGGDGCMGVYLSFLYISTKILIIFLIHKNIIQGRLSVRTSFMYSGYSVFSYPPGN
jgi:hypothetical protein